MFINNYIYKMLSTGFWVGYLVKGRIYFTSAAARVVHNIIHNTDGNGMEMAMCVVWCMKGLFDSTLETRDFRRGFGRALSSNEKAFGTLQLQALHET